MSTKTIHVVDEIMGKGKTSAIFSFMNVHPKKRYIFLTPRLNEIPRVKSSCPALHFCEPAPNGGNKSECFSFLLDKKRNIVTTHKLFFMQIEEISKFLHGYVLISDESPNSLVEDYDDKYHGDYPILFKNYLKLDSDYKAHWTYNPKPEKNGKNGYRGAFSMLKEDCDRGYVRGIENGQEKFLFKVFPANILQELDEIFLLTYLFRLQPSYAFFKSEDFSFDRYYVKEESGKYILTNIPQPQKYIDYFSKIKIYTEKSKRNQSIGSKKGSLSKTWYHNHKKSDTMRKALRRFVDNTVKSHKELIWTVYTDFKDDFSDKCWHTSFLSCNAKSTNDYANRHAVAYLINLYSRPLLSIYFKSKGVAVCDNGFGLTEMIQLIFRSAIRNGEEIYLYVPSKRMRDLFIAWMEFASGKSKNIKGIDVDVYDWDSCKNADKPTVFENKIFNVDTGLISDFGDYADEEKRIIPWEKVSSKAIPSSVQVS